MNSQSKSSKNAGYPSGKDELNLSIDTESTESTASTSYDLSSKDSECSFEHFEFETTSDIRYRGPCSLKDVLGEATLEYHLHNSSKQPQRRRIGRMSKCFALPLNYFHAFALIAIYVLYVSCCSNPEYTSQYRDWKFFLYKQAPVLQQRMRQDETGEKFTIILKGGRLDFLQQSIDAHSVCESVKEVQIDYSSKAIPEIILSRGPNVFRLGEITTSGVLLLSEDVIFSCDEIETAFQAWKKDTSRLVGFFGFRQKRLDGTAFRFRSASIDFEPVPSGLGSYSLVSDRAVFVHNLYLSSIPKQSHDDNCCHLLLSSQVSAVSSKAPIVIKANPRELMNTDSRNGFLVGTDPERSECNRECMPHWLRVNLADQKVTVIR